MLQRAGLSMFERSNKHQEAILTHLQKWTEIARSYLSSEACVAGLVKFGIVFRLKDKYAIKVVKSPVLPGRGLRYGAPVSAS